MPSQMLPDIPYYYLPEILITVIVDPEHISSMCRIDDMVIKVMTVNRMLLPVFTASFEFKSGQSLIRADRLELLVGYIPCAAHLISIEQDERVPNDIFFGVAPLLI